jgi:hypothetical protein
VCKDLSRVSKSIDISNIEFYISNIELIGSDENGYKVLMNLNEVANTKS